MKKIIKILILGSSPLISLTIFSLCLQITNVIANIETTKNAKENFEVLNLRNIKIFK